MWRQTNKNLWQSHVCPALSLLAWVPRQTTVLQLATSWGPREAVPGFLAQDAPSTPHSMECMDQASLPLGSPFSSVLGLVSKTISPESVKASTSQVAAQAAPAWLCTSAQAPLNTCPLGHLELPAPPQVSCWDSS